MMKHTFVLGLLVAQMSCPMWAITLDECQQLARDHYPLIKQYDLIDQANEYTIANANKGYLPQLSLSAKATYQSAVPGLPSEMADVLAPMGIEIPEVNKGQYQAVLELNQVIWDGQQINAQKRVAKAGTEEQHQQLEVSLYQLVDRINQLFIGTLSLQEQLVQNKILTNELESQYRFAKAQQEGGLMMDADVDLVRIHLLDAEQNRIKLQSTVKSFKVMLGYFIGRDIQAEELVRPVPEIALTALQVMRPELGWYASQRARLEEQRSVVVSKNLPRIGAFANGGIGEPGLNLLEPGFSPYYMVGLRLSWNIGALYTLGNDKRMIQNQIDLVDVQEELFRFNTNQAVTQLLNDIERIKGQMKSDDEIIALRRRIKENTQVQVEHGTLTEYELMRQVLDEDAARQQKVNHEMELLNAIYSLKYMVNN